MVGQWAPPPTTQTPTDLLLETPENMKRWEAWCRASVIDFELMSKLGFYTPDGKKMAIRHLNLDTDPKASYQPLIMLQRPSEAQFRDYLVFMQSYADLRADRATEIMTQMSGGLTFFSAIPYLHPARTPYTLELLAATQRLANFCHMRLKQALASRRPNEYAAQVQPMILTPSHSTFPSGHATEAFMAAIVLFKLLQASGLRPYGDMQWLEQLLRLASRIAVNRTIAGVHFPVDSAAGAVFGLTLGAYFVARCEDPSPTYDAYEFDGTKFPPTTGGPLADGDFYWTLYYNTAVGGGQLAPGPYVTRTQGLGMQKNDLLNWVWKRALAEWF